MSSTSSHPWFLVILFGHRGMSYQLNYELQKRSPYTLGWPQKTNFPKNSSQTSKNENPDSEFKIWTLNSSFHFVKLGKIQLLDRRLESHNIIYLVFIKRVHTPPPIHTNTHTIRQLLCSSQVYRQPPVAYTYTCV